MNRVRFIIIILLLYFFVKVCLAFSYLPPSKPSKQVQETHEELVTTTPEPVSQDSGEVISFKIYRPENFNDKTKQDIYDIRKMNVGNSPLYPEYYEPSDAVFGQIVSSKPWYGKYNRPCDSGVSNITRGESLLSTIVNNPNALISPFPYANTPDLSLESDYCKSSDSMLFVPSKIEYTPAQKKLEITYPINDIIIGNNQYNKTTSLLLTALNARDAGYNYITATDIQGGFFYDSSWDNRPYDNIMKIVYNFHDYIHLGTSCGLPGGCNNISPWQEALSFELSARPARIKLKLWKKEPASRNSTPDLYCNLIFE